MRGAPDADFDLRRLRRKWKHQLRFATGSPLGGMARIPCRAPPLRTQPMASKNRLAASRNGVERGDASAKKSMLGVVLLIILLGVVILGGLFLLVATQSVFGVRL